MNILGSQYNKGPALNTKYITGSTIYSYFSNKCDYHLWLEWFGDPGEKVSLNENEDTRLLMEYGNQHEDKIVEDVRKKAECIEPVYSEGNLDEGYQATRALMESGVPYIYQGVLCQGKEISKMVEEKKNRFPGIQITPFFRGIPDILEKKEGSSRLGNYHYIVGDVKSSRKPKPYQKMQVAFYSWLLGDIQGETPETGYIIPITGEKEYFEVDLYRWILKDFLEEELFELAVSRNPFYHYTGSCESCAWSEHCKKKAGESNDLSLLPGLAKRQKKLLARNGIYTIFDAANKMDVSRLSKKWGLGKNGLERIQLQAQSMLSGKKIVKDSPRNHLREGAVLEIYFDMESDPFSDTEYLYGIHLIDRKKGSKGSTEHFLAKSKKEEGATFHRFLARMKQITDSVGKNGGDWVVYHYAHYESSHMRKLMETYDDPYRILENMLEEMVDLYRVIRETVVLPLPSYSIKDVARYREVGFDWRDEESSAAMSYVWYNNFLKDGDEKWLHKIKVYNEDDLIATYKVKEWLASF